MEKDPVVKLLVILLQDRANLDDDNANDIFLYASSFGASYRLISYYTTKYGLQQNDKLKATKKLSKYTYLRHLIEELTKWRSNTVHGDRNYVLDKRHLLALVDQTYTIESDKSAATLLLELRHDIIHGSTLRENRPRERGTKVKTGNLGYLLDRYGTRSGQHFFTTSPYFLDVKTCEGYRFREYGTANIIEVDVDTTNAILIIHK